jgi:hypothetical protein
MTWAAPPAQHRRRRPGLSTLTTVGLVVSDAELRRTADRLEADLVPIAHAPDVPAMDKLHALFATMTPWQERRRDELRAWYSSHDAATWEKLRHEIRTRVAPLLATIIGQGMRERVFAADRHGHVASLTVSLVQNLDERLACLALTRGAWEAAEQAIATFTRAVTDLLGAPAGAVVLVDPRLLRSWFAPGTDTVTD